MFVKFSHFCQLFCLYENVSAEHSELGHMKPGRKQGSGLGATHSLWTAWRALKVFHPAGVDKTISLVSVREALFCTYVSVNVFYGFLPLALMSYEHTAQTYTRHITDNMHRSHRPNAAAHTPCVCDTPMCAVLWLVVFVGVFHRMPDIFSYVCTQADVHPSTFICVVAWAMDHRPDNNSNSPQSLLTSSFLQHNNNPAVQ